MHFILCCIHLLHLPIPLLNIKCILLRRGSVSSLVPSSSSGPSHVQLILLFRSMVYLLTESISGHRIPAENNRLSKVIERRRQQQRINEQSTQQIRLNKVFFSRPETGGDYIPCHATREEMWLCCSETRLRLASLPPAQLFPSV